VFTELDHSDGVQVVKVPVSNAAWSTWRRHCDALDLTMGQAIAGLIGHELGSVVGDAAENGLFVLKWASQERMDQLAARERELDDKAAHLRRIEQQVREREDRLQRKAAMISGART
jgi:hypothetical protein